MAKAKRQTGKITNKRARYDYELGDTFIVGLQLTGPETKALRHAHGQLAGAYVTVKDNELWLLNSTVTGDNSAPISESDVTRSRKLLAKRSEIDKLMAAKSSGYTIVPLEILNKGRFIKIKIALARGKKRYDKREIIKRRDQEREIARNQS